MLLNRSGVPPCSSTPERWGVGYVTADEVAKDGAMAMAMATIILVWQTGSAPRSRLVADGVHPCVCGLGSIFVGCDGTCWRLPRHVRAVESLHSPLGERSFRAQTGASAKCVATRDPRPSLPRCPGDIW